MAATGLATGGAFETTFDSCVRGFHVAIPRPRRMDTGARWNTPLQTLYFILSVPCAQYQIIQCSSNFSSTFCLERCLVYNTELFTAHQILNFRKKNFRRVDIITKMMKIFYYENLELYGIWYLIVIMRLYKARTSKIWVIWLITSYHDSPINFLHYKNISTIN